MLSLQINPTLNFNSLIPGPYDYLPNFQRFLEFDQSNNIRPNMLQLKSVCRNRELQIFEASNYPFEDDIIENLNYITSLISINKHIIFSSSLKYYRNYSRRNILYFPYHFFEGIFSWNRLLALQSINNNDRTYFLSSGDNDPRIYKIYNYINLIQKNYNNQILLNCYRIKDEETYRNQYKLLSDEWMDSNLTALWENYKENLPIDSKEIDVGDPTYQNSYINLVTEKYIDTDLMYLTKETFKPIASGQMFLIMGPVGIISYLKSMGFDTFDDIIDHDRYQFNTNWKKRINIIYEILDELSELDWNNIYKETRLRRLANARHFWSGLAVKTDMEHVAKRMSEIHGVEYKYDYNYILNLHNPRDSIYAELPMIDHLFRN
jgi:hypothetical protein